MPAGRRRQTTVMLLGNLLTGPTIYFSTFLFLWWVLPFGTYLVALYCAWVAYDNFTRPMPSYQRVSQWWRHHQVYHLFRDYFPIRHIKANTGAKFDAKGHYLFCYHPHGVQSAGAFSMANAASGVDELFPGLHCSVQTLNMNFVMPFIREQVRERRRCGKSGVGEGRGRAAQYTGIGTDIDIGRK